MIQIHLHVIYPTKGKLNVHRKQFRIFKLVKSFKRVPLSIPKYE